jgi:alpha-mannosidase
MNLLITVAAGVALGIVGTANGQDIRKPVPNPAPPALAQPDLSGQATLYVVGYAHLDTQWRWTYADTIRQYIPDTLRDNFKLFAKYPDYVFNFSGSRRYRMMEEYYPQDFEALRGHIAAGRWFPCGSSVDENDANVPSAESLVRHVLYGNKYFRRTFGMASEEYMLPDCFGFPAALPSVLAHCGIKGFSTQKLTWNAVVPIPFKVGVWEGPDGHGVIAALDPGAYVGEVKENLATSKAWLDRINASAERSGVFVDYHYFGTGDQGGAPGEKSVAMVQESVDTSGPIKAISGAADLMFKAVTPEQRQRLPRYKGELMLTEHSAGSISSQAYMKRWNRKNELLADAAERACLAAMWMGARPYPGQKLEDAWYLVLGSQMHDILPGTSVPKAYDYSWNDEVLAANQFGAVLEDAAGAVIGGLDTSGEGEAVVVYNPTSLDREDVVEATIRMQAGRGVTVTGPEGKAVPCQVLAAPAQEGPTRRAGKPAEMASIAFVAKVPPVGFAVFHVRPGADAGAQSGSLKVQERQLENDALIVKLDERGDIASLFDKLAKREVLSAPVRLGLHHENPRQWPAWNQDWADRQLPPKAFAGESGPVTFSVVENGPARIAVEVVREAEGSTFVQRIRLCSGAAAGRVEFDTRIDWRTRERSLRAAFPLAVSNPKATFDIQVGALERGNGHERQYEYPFHQWIDLTDANGDYGASIICDSKYASDKPDDRTVRLTLLHTPGTRGGYPDQGTQDLGRHHVLYAIYPHAGDWKTAGTVGQASRVNQPLVPFCATPHPGPLGRSFSLMRTSNPAVEISAAKKAEEGDEVIVRLRERGGKPAKDVRVAVASPIVSAREVDGQEREIGPAKISDGQLSVDIGAYELRAFALKLGAAPAKLPQITAIALALPFDTDAVSTNATRADGSMDDHGAAIPAEQFPGSFSAEGITFTLGPTADGEKNAVSCRGQEIKIPGDGSDRLWLIAAADRDVDTTLQIDGQAVPLHVQGWTGYVGQWDRRVWPREISESAPGTGDIAGIDPGFIREDPVAWYCSHHHTAQGDAFYEYCYLYKYAIDLPAGARSVRLPDEPGVKVFAATAAKVGPARSIAAAPLFDTLGDHKQDPPRIEPGAGTFADSIDVRIEPTLYWRNGAVHYTLDGSDPTPQSPVYGGPILMGAPTTIKAAVERQGHMGPIGSARLEILDRTPPTVQRVEAIFRTPMIRVWFSEPLDPGAAESSNYSFEPSLEVRSVELARDRRSATLSLDSAPETDRSYRVTIAGIRDSSPSRNEGKPYSAEFAVRGPVFSLAEIGPDQRGTTIRNVPGLPVNAKDPWTINVFVRAGNQPPNRTLIAGFGKCGANEPGGARYLAKFANGIQFWSHNRDVGTRTRLDLDRWQMLTATYDGRLLRVYKNAKEIGQGAVQLADDENAVNIAPVDPWEQQRRFEGDIRDFTIWSQALSPEAIQALHEGARLP